MEAAMVLKLGDPNTECKERVLKILDGSNPPEVSAMVANYRASIANALSIHMIDNTIASRLCAIAESFRQECEKAVEDFSDTLSNDNALGEALLKKHHISDSGWYLSPYNPNKLITLFPTLHMRKGYHLGAYQYQDVSAFVFIIPKSRTLPKRPPDKALQSLFYGFSFNDSNSEDNVKDSLHGLPTWASQDIEAYVEGDCSPLSYFQASVFLREITELGKTWHQLYWAHHGLVSAPENLPDEEWTWYEPAPKYWCPVVWKDEGDRWNVTFYTFNDKDADIVFHNDTFTKGYQIETFSTSIAHYPGGYEV
jgi:hypothetical protein